METPCKYDWDDLEVGRMDVNNSEKFFKFRHVKHEKLDEDLKKGMKKELYGNFPEEKENQLNALNNFDTKLKISNEEQQISANKEDVYIENESLSHEQGKEKSATMALTKEISTHEEVNKMLPPPPPPTFLTSSKGCRLPNILAEPRVIKQQPHVKENSKENKVPKAYNYSEVYEKRRQQVIHRIQEEEKKQRIFHSKPIPKFHNNNLHENKQKKPADEHITIPVTPLTLKRSKEMDERRKKKIEEYERKMRPQPFISREPNVLHDEPFKPKKHNILVDDRPFTLHVEKRLCERKAFDKKTKLALEEKKKQEEEEKARKEKELVKEIRKAATFKARPNPFRSYE